MWQRFAGPCSPGRIRHCLHPIIVVLDALRQEAAKHGKQTSRNFTFIAVRGRQIAIHVKVCYNKCMVNILTGGQWKSAVDGVRRVLPVRQHRFPRGGSCLRCDATTSQGVPHSCHGDARAVQWLKNVGAIGSLFVLTTASMGTAFLFAFGYWFGQRRYTKRRLVKPLTSSRFESVSALAGQFQQKTGGPVVSAAVTKTAQRLGVVGEVVVIEPQDRGVDVRARSVAGDCATVEMSGRAMILIPKERDAMVARELMKVTPEGRRRQQRIAAWKRARAPFAAAGSALMLALSLTGWPMMAAGAGLWVVCSLAWRRLEGKQLRRCDEVGYQTGGDSYMKALESLSGSSDRS
jgi:hypothetical protein